MTNIVDEMQAHVDMRAGAPQPVYWHMRIAHILASAGLPTDRAIDLEAFNAAMSKAGVSMEDRLAAKQALGRSGRLTA
jgi:hypothetical protein